MSRTARRRQAWDQPDRAQHRLPQQSGARPPPDTWPYRGEHVLVEVVGVGVGARVGVVVGPVCAQLGTQVVHVVLQDA